MMNEVGGQEIAEGHKHETQLKFKISEIFHSIQGESTLAGERFSFIRLTGCPLRCQYCDTEYAFYEGSWMTQSEITAAIESHQAEHVLITGGEPLANRRTIELVKELVRLKKHVSIETSGEQDVQPYVEISRIIMDIKTPSSSVIAKRCFENLQYLKASDEVKFVLTNRSDYDWAKMICYEYHLCKRFKVLFSPVFNKLDLKDLASWILSDKLNVRLQTQLHKHIWGSNVRGV